LISHLRGNSTCTEVAHYLNIQMKLRLVGVCILYLSLPLALGLKCEAGCKVSSGVPGSEKACNGMTGGMITCDQFFDRCMTTKLNIPGPFRGFSSDMEIKNCSSSFVCEPSSDYYLCKLMNSTGMMASCSLHCCEGDMCNGAVHLPGFIRRLLSRIN